MDEQASTYDVSELTSTVLARLAVECELLRREIGARDRRIIELETDLDAERARRNGQKQKENADA